MSKDSGYLVKTKTGKEGRTYHREGLVDKKMVVHVDIDGKEVKMLCDPKTIEIIGYID
jgi:hypothetical protein